MECARNASDLDTVQAFRTTYPKSAHVAEADQKIAALEAGRRGAEAAGGSGVGRGQGRRRTGRVAGLPARYPNSVPHGGGEAKARETPQGDRLEQQRENAEWGRVEEFAAIRPRCRTSWTGTQIATHGRGRAENHRRAAEARGSKERERLGQGQEHQSTSPFYERVKDLYPGSPTSAEADRKIVAAHQKIEGSEKARDG